MKSSVVGALAFLSLAGGAWSADLPPAAPPPATRPVVVPPPAFYYDWTGFYIGGNAGYGWARPTLSATDGVVTVSVSDNWSGPIAGGLLGFNIQAGSFVGGIEADYQWSDQKKSVTVLGVTFTDRISAFATVRARAGVAVDRVFLYATGGYAHFEFKSEATAAGLTVSNTTNQSGWTAGAGIEGAVWGNLILRGEYLYLQSQDKTTVVAGVTVTGRVTDNIARAALIYKFGGGPVRAGN
jgi:outer membrane immunogenic protein